MPELATYRDPVVIALETTGSDPYHDRITEISAVAYENGKEKDFFQRDIPADSCDLDSILQDS